MPALDKSGADRIAPFAGLFDSRNGEKRIDIAALFKQAAALLEVTGYDRYSRTEDATAAGLTIFEALESVARLFCTAARKAAGLEGADLERVVELDTNQLADELATRLAGVLIVTGQANTIYCKSDLTEVLWGWTMDATDRPGGQYRGQDHAVKLLNLAALMTMAIED